MISTIRKVENHCPSFCHLREIGCHMSNTPFLTLPSPAECYFSAGYTLREASKSWKPAALVLVACCDNDIDVEAYEPALYLSF